MSYQRRYSETLSGVVHDHISYPASENGGSISVSLEWSEDIYIDIYVNTDDFHSGVRSLRGHLDALTGSVVATEAAHVHEKEENARRMAASLNSGFNQLIRSEISQQTASLSSRVDSLLLKLHDLGHACSRTQDTMQNDYSRITERYAHVFEELDREVHRRVSSLDGASMRVRIEVQDQMNRTRSSRLCGIAAITAAENARAQMKLVAAGVRMRAHELLQRAVHYLEHERRIARSMNAMTMPSNSAASAVFSLPVLYMESDGRDGPTRQAWMRGGAAPALENLRPQAHQLFQHDDFVWEPMSEASRRQTEQHLLARLDTVRSGNPERDARIRGNVLRLWNKHAPQVLRSAKAEEQP